MYTIGDWSKEICGGPHVEQTGALVSRLNNDVVGAQNAVTSTLGSVVSNVVVLATTLAAMVALEWRLTLLALIVLPLFVVPAKR